MTSLVAIRAVPIIAVVNALAQNKARLGAPNCLEALCRRALSGYRVSQSAGRGRSGQAGRSDTGDNGTAMGLFDLFEKSPATESLTDLEDFLLTRSALIIAGPGPVAVPPAGRPGG